MDFKNNRYNSYGTEQEAPPLPSADISTGAVFTVPVSAYAAVSVTSPQESFDNERIQKISVGAQLETQTGMIIHNQNSRLEIADYNWFGYNSKTLLVGEKSTINFTLGSKGMSEFSFDYFALHNSKTVVNFYDVNGKLIGSEKLLYTGSVTAKNFDIQTLTFTAPSGTQIARAELVTGDEPAVGDYGFHIDNLKWSVAGLLPVDFTIDFMSKDSGTSAHDFITNDGSANRIIEGTLSRVISSSETLQFWNGTKWVNATVKGLTWQAQDNTAHSADWEYKLRVIDADGETTPEYTQPVVLDVTPSPIQIIFDRMSKDDGTDGDWRTTDGSAMRTVTGSLDRALDAGDIIEYSYDGGRSWHKLTLNGLDWSFNDPDSHDDDWKYQIRITDIAGNIAQPAVQHVILLPGAITFTFNHMEKDTGSSETDFITKDGSAGRRVDGTMSRALAPGESLEFWNGSHWVTATVNGLNWHVADTTAHSSDWEYKVRVVDASGHTTPEQNQPVVLDVTPSDVEITFDYMSKDDGSDTQDWITSDGSAGRYVYGSFSKALSPGDVAEYSLDGGITWQKLTVTGDNWSFIDTLTHTADWHYQLRITDVAGNTTTPVIQSAVLLPPAISITFKHMEKDTGTSDSDFITKDGSAGRRVEGTLSRALYPGETLEFWDGTKWVTATASGLTWHAQDDVVHTTDWLYQLRVIDASGSTIHDNQQPVKLIPLPVVQITFDHMDKDDGINGDWHTGDGSADRLVYGKLSQALNPGDVVEYSLDGGKTWQTADLKGLNWSFCDPNAHGQDWTYLVRITDVAGNIAAPVSQDVVLLPPPPISLTFERMEKDTGISDTDFITNDGSAGRKVEGTLSRALNTGETLEMWDGIQWVKVAVDGLTWQAQDDSVHTADWQYKLRVVNAGGTPFHEHTQDVVLDLSLPDAADLSGMGRDSGWDSQNLFTNDGREGRVYWGNFNAAETGVRVEVTIDGGLSWHDAMIDGDRWIWQDTSAHSADWTLQTRITDRAGNTVEGKEHALRMDTTPPNPPELINREADKLTVSLKNSQVVAGDKIVVHIDGKNAFYTLTNADIQSGLAIVTLPANCRMSAEYRAAFVDAHGNVSDYFSRTPLMFDFENQKAFSNPVPNKAYDFGLFSIIWSGSSSYHGITGVAKEQGMQYPTNTLGISCVGDPVTLQLNHGRKSNRMTFEIKDLTLGDIKIEFYDGNTLAYSYKAYMKNGLYQYLTVDMPAGKEFTSIKFIPATSGDVLALDNLNFWVYDDKILPTETSQKVLSGDQLSVGVGQDNTFIVNQIKDLSKIEMLNGNGGTDTLKLAGASQSLDLTSFLGKIQSIEIFDITGKGNNTLTLSLGDVLQQGGKDLFNHSGNVQMMVKGNAGDKVILSDLLPNGADVGNWNSSGNVTVGGVVYSVWQHDSLTAELLVQSGVTMDLINH